MMVRSSLSESFSFERQLGRKLTSDLNWKSYIQSSIYSDLDLDQKEDWLYTSKTNLMTLHFHREDPKYTYIMMAGYSLIDSFLFERRLGREVIYTIHRSSKIDLVMQLREEW